MDNTFHVALIPDGNRRWAKQHGLTAYAKLYTLGIDRMLENVEAALEHGATHISLWGSSYANITGRASGEVSALDSVYRDNLHRFADHPMIQKYGIAIDVIGEWRDKLSSDTVRAFEETIERTRHNSGRILTLFISYSGDREREAALAHLLSRDQPARPPYSDALRASSWTHTLPPVDLIIRTGAWRDPHNSAGFLNLLADEAQYAFPDVYWPDFTPHLLTQLLDDYAARERRHGA